MIEFAEVHDDDEATRKEWFARTALNVQLAGAPGEGGYKFVAAHGRKDGGQSCLVLQYPDTKLTMWILTGGTQDERKAQTESIREKFRSEGWNIKLF